MHNSHQVKQIKISVCKGNDHSITENQEQSFICDYNRWNHTLSVCLWMLTPFHCNDAILHNSFNNVD